MESDPMKRWIYLLVLLVLAADVMAEEIDAEVNLSLVDPYGKVTTGFTASFRPEMLEWRGLSLGGGLGLHISNRFKYDQSPLNEFDPGEAYTTDTTTWYYFNKDFVEIINFDLYLEGRWRFFGAGLDDRFKGSITLSAGAIINSVAGTLKQTVFEGLNDTDPIEILGYGEYTYNLESEYRTDLYFSPGLIVDIKRFIVGYRHLFYFDDPTLIKGKAGRTVGIFRLGYRFFW